MRSALALAVALVGCKADAPAAKDAAVRIQPVARTNRMPADWWTKGCPEVLAAIDRCADDAGFVDALTAGMDRAEHKLTLGRIADRKNDRAPEVCGEMPSTTFSAPGFLDGDWQALAAPDLLGDCAKLGAAIRQAGGLFGGSSTR